MAKLFLTSGLAGPRFINLELVREASQSMDGVLTLRFDSSHAIQLQGIEAHNCMDELNKLAGYHRAQASPSQSNFAHQI